MSHEGAAGWWLFRALQDSSCCCSSVSQGLDRQSSEMLGTDLAVLVYQLAFVQAWIEYLSCGAQFISMASTVLALLILKVVDLSAL